MFVWFLDFLDPGVILIYLGLRWNGLVLGNVGFILYWCWFDFKMILDLFGLILVWFYSFFSRARKKRAKGVHVEVSLECIQTCGQNMNPEGQEMSFRKIQIP